MIQKGGVCSTLRMCKNMTSQRFYSVMILQQTLQRKNHVCGAIVAQVSPASDTISAMRLECFYEYVAPLKLSFEMLYCK